MKFQYFWACLSRVAKIVLSGVPVPVCVSSVCVCPGVHVPNRVCAMPELGVPELGVCARAGCVCPCRVCVCVCVCVGVWVWVCARLGCMCAVCVNPNLFLSTK
jgi:hypothetical protein